MICEACHGEGWRHYTITNSDGKVIGTECEPCPACRGSGQQSCCDGIAGGADEVTNTGDAAPSRKRGK